MSLLSLCLCPCCPPVPAILMPCVSAVPTPVSPLSPRTHQPHAHVCAVLMPGGAPCPRGVPADCSKQDEQFSLVFTIGSFMNNLMTFPMGFIFDRFGTAVARLIAM